MSDKAGLQLHRVATTTEPSATDDVTDVTSPSSRRQYVTLRRQRPTAPTSAQEESTEQKSGRRQYVGD